MVLNEQQNKDIGCMAAFRLIRGDYSTVGAISVLTHDVPAHAVVASVPAKIIK